MTPDKKHLDAEGVKRRGDVNLAQVQKDAQARKGGDAGPGWLTGDWNARHGQAPFHFGFQPIPVQAVLSGICVNGRYPYMQTFRRREGRGDYIAGS
jgi:hypothetical protein